MIHHQKTFSNILNQPSNSSVSFNLILVSLNKNDAFLFQDQVLSAPTNKVLVHCSAGISRSPTLVLAYMIKNENLTVEEALKKMRSLRSIIDPNFSFIAQLRVWEKKCRTKIDFKDDNRSINTPTINQSVQPRSRSSSQYCGSNSSNKNDGKTPIVVN